MTPKILTSLEEALNEVNQAETSNGLQLHLADEVWRDAPGTSITGANIALIMFTAVRRGLLPDGSEQYLGYKVFNFKRADKKETETNV